MAKRTQLGVAPVPEVWRPEVGARLGEDYLLVAPIGRGGMGQVWEAEQLELRRRVAVKILDDDALSTVAMQRFVREVHALSDVRHPNLVPVLDAGWVEGRPYLVMPRLSGRDLGEELEARGRLPLAEVVALLEGPAAALDALHRAGRVHRDIKPENLFVTRDEDGAPFVQILDFGLTTLMGDDRARITREGIVCGTPEYVSPEGAVGEIPDRRGDVYSLAVVAFELLTGELPFYSERRLELLVSKVERDPPTLASLGFPASPRVEEAMAHGLARDRDARFERATAFLRALRAGASDAPPAPAPRPRAVVVPAVGGGRSGDHASVTPTLVDAARAPQPVVRGWAPATTPRDVTHTRLRTGRASSADAARQRLESAPTVAAPAAPRPDELPRSGLAPTLALATVTALTAAAVAWALLAG